MASNVRRVRNLNKNQLGGVIFGCTKVTMRECLAKQLFGLPPQHFSYVKNIEPGLPLFLFNYSERKLHGIYEAASLGKMNIDSYAWTGDGSERTKYPAQVQIRVCQQCQRLTEDQFKSIISDNYYSQTHFMFELDHAQTNKLISVFLSSVVQGLSVPQRSPKCTAGSSVLINKKTEENEASQPPPLANDFANSYNSVGTSSTLEDFVCVDGNNQLMDDLSCSKNLESSEKDLIYLKLREMALSSEFSDANIGHVAGSDFSNVVREAHLNDTLFLGRNDNASSSAPLDFPAVILKLSREMEELKTFKEEQTQKMEILEKKLAAAELEIHRLEKKCMTWESISNTSSKPFDEKKQLGWHDELLPNLNDSILIVGGYDGKSWSTALDSFFPSHDVLRSLKPMSSARAFCTLARCNGELYVCGGGTGSVCYDTVESYDPVQDEWTKCPPLNKGKISLAGAALNGKIFAVGGGNGLECFSDVEMFDPYVCQWISACPMLHKRFALAAVELNGALYAVGGYDGHSYLRSAERFDHRENSWTRIESMNTKRGCHALVVMNEKLYAIGGHDGMAMIPSVEIYDPRLGTWIPGEQMNQRRGYFVAGVIKDSIYAIGGLGSDEEIVDKIECYKDGQGWLTTSLTAVGKRSFASAIVLQGD